MATSSLEEHDVSVAAATAALDSQLPMQSNHIICRGITNANGTGCHTSSALQLLFHCFPRLREDLLNIANVSASYTAQQSLSSTSDEENNSVKAIEKEFVYQLSWFFYLLANAEDIIAIAQEASSSSAAIPESRTKQKQNKRKKSKRKKKVIDEKKAAAIDAFVTKSRQGKTNMHEWRNLVDAMKELNRKKYDEALGQVMNRRSSDEERSGTGGQHIGNLGGGRKSATCELSSSTLEGAGDAIDPTKFYEQLMSYTIEAMEARHHINTNNVGDAAVVFRCLIATLEFSINRELTRLDEFIGLFEIDNWNDGETKEGEDNLPSGQRNAYELRSSLAKVKDAMEYEWKGNLLSRIVGINQTGAVSPDNIITTTTITRTKKNGNIERPIPIPWQLPVLAQTDNVKLSTGKDKVDDSTISYFESLSTSLHSVTICPNPIRGYNWNGLVKSGDVNEETTITKMDMDGNFLVDKEEEAKDSSEELEAIKSISPVEEPIVIVESKDDEEKGSEEFKSLAITAHSDDVSVVSTTSRASVASVSSRTIGTQTDLGDDVEVKTITVRTSTVTTESETTSELETQTNEKAVGEDADTSAGIGVGDTTETVSETSSSKDASSQNSAIKFAIKKDACYAAAVTALSTASKARRSPRRDKPKQVPAASVSSAPARNERDMCYAAAVAALAGSVAIRNVAIDDIEVSYTTSNSINSDDEISHVFSDESNSESSLDSKVPSADDEPSVASSETHSSAIDTPSDIDDISLGSWTDSEADEEKKNDHEPLITDIYPVIRAQECHDAKATANADEQAVSPSVQEKAEASDVVPTEIAHSVCSNSVLAVSTLNSDSASSSSDDSSTSSSSTSSTGSDSTSSTDSSSTSSSSSSSDSSSSDRDATNTEGTENDDEENIAYNNNSTKKKEWTTRKETRFCQPLPRSLIFHLKRFTFTPSGHGEKLPGSLDIPEELNLRTCCLEQQQDDDESSSEHYCYQLTGALVHVDPVLSEDEQDHLDYGAMSEGHYVTFICKPTENKQDNKAWIELDDEFVRVVGSSGDELSADTALNVLSGCDVSNNAESCGTSTSSSRILKEKERRYATLVVYSRKS